MRLTRRRGDQVKAAFVTLPSGSIKKRLGFRGLGFRGLGFTGLGFRGLGVQSLGV